MAEYIDREDAIREVMAAKWQDGMDGAMAMQIVAAAPAADVAPVRHARWEVDELGFLKCTNCAWVRHGIPLVEHYPYCPNCGARMDLGGDGNA